MNPFTFITRPDPMPGSWPGQLPEAPAPDEGAVYRLPYPPPAGRRVTDRLGQIWRIHTDGVRPDGDDQAPPTEWGALLSVGPVHLIPLTEQEQASERVYGPIGARWGQPGTPCAYRGCARDQGHIGAHQDSLGNPLGITDQATTKYVDPPRGAMLRRICTCGNPAQHQPGCARYVEPPDTPEGDLAPMELATHNQPNSMEAFANLIGAPDEDPDPAQTHEMPDGTTFIGTMDAAIAHAKDILDAAAVPAKRPRKVTPPPASARKRTPRKKTPDA